MPDYGWGQIPQMIGQGLQLGMMQQNLQAQQQARVQEQKMAQDKMDQEAAFNMMGKGLSLMQTKNPELQQMGMKVFMSAMQKGGGGLGIGEQDLKGFQNITFRDDYADYVKEFADLHKKLADKKITPDEFKVGAFGALARFSKDFHPETGTKLAGELASSATQKKASEGAYGMLATTQPGGLGYTQEQFANTMQGSPQLQNLGVAVAGSQIPTGKEAPKNLEQILAEKVKAGEMTIEEALAQKNKSSDEYRQEMLAMRKDLLRVQEAKQLSEPDKQIVSKALVELPKLSSGAKTAQNSVQQIDRALELVEKGGVTGKGGQLKAFLAPYAEFVGIPSTKLDEAQSFQLLTRAIVGPMRLDLIGPGPVSEWEQKLMQKLGGGGGAAKAAAKELLNYYRSLGVSRIKNYNETLEGIKNMQPNIGALYRPIDMPSGKAAPAMPAPAQNVSTEKYTLGSIYEDASGRKAKYLGGGKWQIVK